MIIQFYETIWWNSEYLFGHELFSIFTACCCFIENSKTPSHSNQWKQWSLKNAGLTCINVVAKKLKNIPLRRLIVWGGGLLFGVVAVKYKLGRNMFSYLDLAIILASFVEW